MNKKILSVIVITLFMSVIKVFAADLTWNSKPGEKEQSVSLNVPSGYVISIPATVNWEGEEALFYIEAKKLNLDYGKAVYIKPDSQSNTFYLQKGNDKIGFKMYRPNLQMPELGNDELWNIEDPLWYFQGDRLTNVPVKLKFVNPNEKPTEDGYTCQITYDIEVR